MYVLRRIPACLSVLLVAAMLLRQGVPLVLLLGAAVLACAAVLVPWPPAAQRGLGIAIGAMALPWLLVAWTRVDERLFRGESWGRLLAILLGVAAFTAWSGWLLATRKPPVPVDPLTGGARPRP